MIKISLVVYVYVAGSNHDMQAQRGAHQTTSRSAGLSPTNAGALDCLHYYDYYYYLDLGIAYDGGQTIWVKARGSEIFGDAGETPSIPRVNAP